MSGENDILARLRSFERGESAGPVDLYLFVSTSCPLKCRFCARQVFTDLGRDEERDVANFLAAALFELEPAAASRITDLAAEGAPRLLNILINPQARKAARKMDEMTEGAPASAYSIFARFPSIVSGMPEEFREPLTAYAICLVRKKLRRDMAYRMPAGRFSGVIEEAAALGVRNVFISGSIGEPLMEPQLLAMCMRRITEAGMTGHLATNGYPADHGFARMLVETRWPSVVVSLDGARPEVHDRLRGRKGSFERAAGLISGIMKYRERAGCEVPRVSVSFVLNRLNYHSVIEHLELMKGLSVDSVYYSPMRIYSQGARDELAMSGENQKTFISMIEGSLDVIGDSPVENNLATFLKCGSTDCEAPVLRPRREMIEDAVGFAACGDEDIPETDSFEKARCFEPWRSMTVDAGGNVMQCCSSSLSLIGMNVMDHSLPEIWNSGRYRMLRARFARGELPAECEHHCFPSILHEQMLLSKALKEMKREERGSNAGPFLLPVRRADEAYAKITGKRGKLEDILRGVGRRISND